MERGLIWGVVAAERPSDSAGGGGPSRSRAALGFLHPPLRAPRKDGAGVPHEEVVEETVESGAAPGLSVLGAFSPLHLWSDLRMLSLLWASADEAVDTLPRWGRWRKLTLGGAVICRVLRGSPHPGWGEEAVS